RLGACRAFEDGALLGATARYRGYDQANQRDQQKEPGHDEAGVNRAELPGKPVVAADAEENESGNERAADDRQPNEESGRHTAARLERKRKVAHPAFEHEDSSDSPLPPELLYLRKAAPKRNARPATSASVV